MSSVSVSQLVSYLKRMMDSDDRLQRVEVSGEISNYHRHSSGHLYFTLKDEYAQISCAMFRSHTSTLRFEPKNGDKVLVIGNVSVFEKSGQMQLYVSRIEAAGIGALYQRYEMLKQKLSQEGLFSDEHKKRFTLRYPERIAVLVGERSAAMSDIRRSFQRRWPVCNVDYYPVLVQGEEAPKDIIRNLKEVDELSYDAVILARGGGSFEDLFCFNDEELVRAIYSMKTFLVSGVGHEQDVTLTDFVADLRAATPTAAVELITPDLEDVLYEIDEMETSIQEAVEDLYEENRSHLEDLLSSKVFIDPLSLTERQGLLFDYYVERLKGFASTFRKRSSLIDELRMRMEKNILLSEKDFSYKNEESARRIRRAIAHQSEKESLRLKRMETLLHAYSKENVLKRGFSLVMRDGKVLTGTGGILINDDIEVQMKDGSFKAEVREVKHGRDEV